MLLKSRQTHRELMILFIQNFYFADLNSLHQSFQEAFVNNCSTQRVFDGVMEFIDVCSIALDDSGSNAVVVDKDGNVSCIAKLLIAYDIFLEIPLTIDIFVFRICPG